MCCCISSCSRSLSCPNWIFAIMCRKHLVPDILILIMGWRIAPPASAQGGCSPGGHSNWRWMQQNPAGEWNALNQRLVPGPAGLTYIEICGPHHPQLMILNTSPGESGRCWKSISCAISSRGALMYLEHRFSSVGGHRVGWLDWLVGRLQAALNMLFKTGRRKSATIWAKG